MADINSAFNKSSFQQTGVFNQWNRVGSDKCNQQRRKMENAKPLKYMTTPLVEIGDTLNGEVSMLGSTPLQYTANVSSRPELTNQRFIHQLRPSMYMSRAYEGNGEFIGEESGSQVHTSSMLRPEVARVSKSCNVAGAEIDRFDAIPSGGANSQLAAASAVPDPEYLVRGGASTRNDFKNMFNNCSK